MGVEWSEIRLGVVGAEGGVWFGEFLVDKYGRER